MLRRLILRWLSEDIITWNSYMKDIVQDEFDRFRTETKILDHIRRMVLIELERIKADSIHNLITTYIKSEEFIDQLVLKINRKQLKGE